MDSENRCMLQFRCANTGRRFVALFSRKKGTERFHFENVIDEKDLTGQEIPVGVWKPAAPQTPMLASEIGPPASSLLQGLTQALRSLRRSKGLSFLQKKEQPQNEHTKSASTFEFNIADFDFTGWYCPCCGHAKLPSISVRFVRCGHCGEYVCGGRVKRIDNERLQFDCYDRCGNSGILTGSTLSRMAGLEFNIRKPLELEGGAGKLQAPTARFLPSKNKNE